MQTPPPHVYPAQHSPCWLQASPEFLQELPEQPPLEELLEPELELELEPLELPELPALAELLEVLEELDEEDEAALAALALAVLMALLCVTSNIRL